MSLVKKYVGLDVSKEKIAVALADEGRGDPRYYGVISHSKEAVHKLIKQLQKDDVELEVCYEAGPTGFPLYRWFLEWNIACSVVAPSLIPKRAGDRVKTDKRDALRLAQLFRAGELVSVHVPTPEEEALRDLVRARESARMDLSRHKQQLGKWLLRNQLRDPKGSKPWTQRFQEWLDGLTFATECQRFVFQELRQTILEAEKRVQRFDKEVERQAKGSEQAPVIEALQALRGVAMLTATTLVSEIMSIERFSHPAMLMSYCGLVPSERSSGGGRWQGQITKAGNAHLRRILVEAAKHYRYPPSIKRKKKEQMPPELPGQVLSIAWDTQIRLHNKYKEMKRKGKHSGKIAVAIARELVGFVWAIMKEMRDLAIGKEAGIA